MNSTEIYLFNTIDSIMRKAKRENVREDGLIMSMLTGYCSSEANMSGFLVSCYNTYVDEVKKLNSISFLYDNEKDYIFRMLWQLFHPIEQVNFKDRLDVENLYNKIYIYVYSSQIKRYIKKNKSSK